jgi:DUF1680 family protein
MRCVISILCTAGLAGGALAGDIANLTPVPFTAVKFEDEFWAPRIRTTIEKTIPACFDQCEKTGRIANWDRAAKKEGKFEGYFFNDSDVYKVIEAAAYAIKLDPNATYKGRKLDEYVDELIAKIAAMQQPDGYVNSYFVLTGEPKWTDIEHKHELYCAGHLIEAAVAHYECTGKRNLLNVAVKLARNILNTFGADKNANPCGHPEIELALCKLARVIAAQGELPLNSSGASAKLDQAAAGEINTFLDREGTYINLAKFFVDQHGRKNDREKLWGEYALDHKPLKEQTEIVGHAVRAMYLLSAATDLARQVPDTGYIPALDALWRDLTERKMYITGGIGSSASNEGFTTAYDLPNERAYAETCASIGLVFWAHRMNLLHGDAKYFDVLERALYNNVLAAISLDGTQFNYVNPLASRGQHRRQPWHACACCPPNLARLFPTVGGYMYAQDEKSIYINLYAQSTATFQHGDAKVTIRQKTRYPWDGTVEFIVSVDKPCEFDLHLRVPGWCRGSRLSIGGEPVGEATTQNGYSRIAGKWRGETALTCEMPMLVERVHCDPRVKANVGRVAIQCGPLVYCAESIDNDGAVRASWVMSKTTVPPGPADARKQPPAAALPGVAHYEANSLGGMVVISGSDGYQALGDDECGLYRKTRPSTLMFIKSIPYYAWNNRDAGDMLVWIPESPAFLDPQPVAWLKPSASHCFDRDTVAALNDRLEPADSSDAGIPRFTWWPKKGDEQWVQYDFDKPRRISAVEVYWFDDARHGGGCKPPAAWKLQVKKGDSWADANGASAYATDDDRFNRVSFEPTETTSIRIIARLAEGFSAGILEWKISAD